jgi:hypothetical protein
MDSYGADILGYPDQFFLEKKSKFRQISPWKIWFQPRQRIFHEENDSNSPDFKNKNKFLNRQIFQIFIVSCT